MTPVPSAKARQVSFESLFKDASEDTRETSPAMTRGRPTDHGPQSRLRRAALR